MIDHVLAATNRSALHYIGHSQGCTAFFVMTSLRPEYNRKVITMHAMSPAVYIQHTKVVDHMVIDAMEPVDVYLAF